MADCSGLPGADLVEAGLEDLRRGRETTCSLLVRIGEPRLRRLGILVPACSEPEHALPEHRLYQLLVESGTPDPYSAYNALLRRLVSFEQALENLTA